MEQVGTKRSPSPGELADDAGGAEQSRRLKVKRLSENAVLPVRASAGAAGYDLFAAEDQVINPASRRVIKTDISIAVPTMHYGRIAPRSGLSFKNGIDIGAGVIDEDYTGPVGVLMVNNGTAPFEVKKGNRIAQLLLERVSQPEVEEVEELPQTARGAKGFGSTGTGALTAPSAKDLAEEAMAVVADSALPPDTASK
jgi:dUTP pyrophosphatase